MDLSFALRDGTWTTSLLSRGGNTVSGNSGPEPRPCGTLPVRGGVGAQHIVAINSIAYGYGSDRAARRIRAARSDSARAPPATSRVDAAIRSWARKMSFMA